jgi:hypothetical protein
MRWNNSGLNPRQPNRPLRVFGVSVFETPVWFICHSGPVVTSSNKFVYGFLLDLISRAIVHRLYPVWRSGKLVLPVF